MMGCYSTSVGWKPSGWTDLTWRDVSRGLIQGRVRVVCGARWSGNFLLWWSLGGFGACGGGGGFVGTVRWGTESGLPVFMVNFSGVGSGAKGELYTAWPICGRVGALRSLQRIKYTLESWELVPAVVR
jgi:hypothetical protein